MRNVAFRAAVHRRSAMPSTGEIDDDVGALKILVSEPASRQDSN